MGSVPEGAPIQRCLPKKMGFGTKTGFSIFYSLVSSSTQMDDIRMVSLLEGGHILRELSWKFGGEQSNPPGATIVVFGQKWDLAQKLDVLIVLIPVLSNLQVSTCSMLPPGVKNIQILDPLNILFRRIIFGNFSIFSICDQLCSKPLDDFSVVLCCWLV